MLDHIGQIPAHAARNFQDREALVFEGVSYSFNELNTLIEKTAGALHGLGIGEGDVVTLYASNSWQWVVSYFAIARIGAVITPVNTMLTPVEFEFVVKDCGARAIITSADKVAGIMGVKNSLNVTSIISFGPAPSDAISFDDLISGDTAAPAMPDVAPEALSTIAYTSGTTGHPKGAMQSHKAVIFNGAMTTCAGPLTWWSAPCPARMSTPMS